jgi:DnaK suppressor protein
MDELSADQLATLEAALLAQRDELQQLLAATREGTKPVALDEPIGRLTRMDAIQQQSMAAATRRRYDLRLKQVLQALSAMDRDEYGRCRKCEDPIGQARLEARPESPYCLDCQNEIDRKHG